MIGHPLTDPAVACELTMRERSALMAGPDWEEQIDRVLSWPVGCEALASHSKETDT